jgi:hypothetical protein
MSDTRTPPSVHWEETLQIFLKEAGLVRALNGLGEDLLVLSPEWEQQHVSPALAKLTYDLQVYRTPPSLDVGTHSYSIRDYIFHHQLLLTNPSRRERSP